MLAFCVVCSVECFFRWETVTLGWRGVPLGRWFSLWDWEYVGHGKLERYTERFAIFATFSDNGLITRANIEWGQRLISIFSRLKLASNLTDEIAPSSDLSERGFDERLA